MNFTVNVLAQPKIISLEELDAWRREYLGRVVATNGCFDLLHIGHVTFLQEASTLGDVLVVGVNADESVKELKGPRRPINKLTDRVTVLAALECVDFVVPFPTQTAVEFLAAAHPSVWVKGGDWTMDKLDPFERATVAARGGITKIIPSRHGISTTHIINKALA